MSATDGDYTNVPDKEERKRIRRRRIEKRQAAETNGGDENTDALSQGAQKSGQQQVSESLFHLDRRKYVGIQDVTAVRVITDENESKRRIEDEKMRHERLAKLQQEALLSAKANAAIEMKWAELQDKEIPQELHREIQIQMAACAGIIQSKDSLISEFQRQLRGKDEEYVRALRKQAEDIEDLLSRIRKEFHEMHADYDKELDAIEDAFSEERDKIINDHNVDMDELFDHRRNKEVQYKEAKQRREEQYQREMEELITRGADQYNKLKIELEMNIQTLKQQLEEIRATYQLNTEKLDYNYRVLTELDVEKNAELTRYKRRLARLKEQLNHLVSHFNEMDAQDSKKNSELTDDYRRLTQKYKDLQAKFRHFELADTSKFEEVWTMHDEEAKDMVDQLLKADKVIAEQQLGWVWRAPDMRALQGALGRNGHLAGSSQILPNTDDSAGSMTGTLMQPEDEKSNKSGDARNTAACGSVVGVGGTAGGVATPNANGSLADAPNIYPVSLRSSDSVETVTVSGSRVRAVLRLLEREADFLLNPQVQQALSELPEEEAVLSRAENLLRALGVKSEERLRSLVSYFFRDSGQQHSWTSTNGEIEEIPGELRLLFNNPDEEADLKKIIRPEDVIGAVKAFVDDVTDGPQVLGGGNALTTSTADDVTKGGKKRLQGLQLYWGQLAQVVSDESAAVWRQLEKDLILYKDVLAKREMHIAEVDALSRKNTELKRVLNQYLGSRSNEFLQVPPAQTMRIRPLNELGGTGLKTSKPTKKILMSASR